MRVKVQEVVLKRFQLVATVKRYVWIVDGAGRQ